MPRHMSDKGKALLTQWEGLELQVYLDVAGLPTIGVGHLLTAAENTSKRLLIDGESIDYTAGLTEQQAEKLLSQDLVRFEDVVDAAVSVNLNDDQFDALVSFSFNEGTEAFRTSTMVLVLNQGEYDKVPDELRRWVKSDGRTVQGLVRRRENEIKLWNGET
jgi:lysozyme